MSGQRVVIVAGPRTTVGRCRGVLKDVPTTRWALSHLGARSPTPASTPERSRGHLGSLNGREESNVVHVVAQASTGVRHADGVIPVARRNARLKPSSEP